MSGLRKLQCDNCGGIIDGVTLTCQSCGMQYMLKDDMTLCKMVTSDLEWSTVSCCISVPSYVLFEAGQERATEMTIKQMIDSLAPKLLPFMEFQSSFDPKYNDMVTYGRIRVAEPIVNRYGKVQMQMPTTNIFKWNEK